MDLFALASLEESFPLAILEAMTSGLAVVATAVGGVPECVVSGRTGLLVPPADPGALSKAIVALALDPARRRQLGQAGAARVREHFSSESQAAAIEAALRSVTARRRAA
jgi:glycosyltransferase involved in cell wall biosynthesis